MKTLRRRLTLRMFDLMGRDTETFAPHGIRVRVPRSTDPNLRYILAMGRPYEAPEADLVQRLVRPGMNVIELGGCLGIVSATIRRQIGPDASHIVVEANPDLVAVCRQNAAIGADAGKMILVEAAIDYSGHPEVRFANARTAHSGRIAETGNRAVPATTLSRLRQQLPPGPYALVCDIEGAEAAMVAHDADAIAAAEVIIMEMHPRDYPKKRADLEHIIASLAKLGFTVAGQSENVWGFARAVPAGALGT